MKFLVGLLVLVSLHAQAQSIVAARMTNLTSNEVFRFLSSIQNLEIKSEQQFSKLEFILKNRIKVDRVSIETCGEPFQDGVDLYINYNDEFKFVEGGKKILNFDLKSKDVEAITFNFRRSVTFCLKKVSLEFDGHNLPITVPQVFSAKTDDFNLFDSKLNTFAKAKSLKHPMVVTVKPQNPIVFDQIMLWPGNFTNDIIFKNFERPKELKVGCDQKPQQSFELADVMKIQYVKMSQALSCQNLRLEFISGSEGSEVKELVVSELRFLNGEQILIPDLSGFENRRKKEIMSEFEKSDLSKVLERQLLSIETPIASMIRLHADGSFFIHGFDELAKENDSFYVIGEMTAKAVQKGRIDLHLKGIKRSNRLEMDSLSCGRRCMSENDFSSEKDFFEEDFLLRRGRDGFYRIDTTTQKKDRRIDFTSVRFLLDHSL